MNCAICGFPLTSSHTVCPRCGARAVSAGGYAIPDTSPPQAFTPFQPSFANPGQDARAGGSYVDSAMSQANWNTLSPSWQAAMTPMPSQEAPTGSGMGNSTPQHNHYGPTGAYGQGGEQGQHPLYLTPSGSVEPSLGTYNALPQTPPVTTSGMRRPRSSRFGFTIAGLCLICGALILVFVYFLAPGLDTASNQSSTTNNPISVPTVSPSPTVAASPTPTFPGQQYISDAQMASQVDTTTAQPIMLATTFKAGQRIYVTFNVHAPNDGPGGVCLLWYLNDKLIPTSAYNFSVNSSTSAYSYFTIDSAGNGSVEIYWLASPQSTCADPTKLLGTRLQFTITS
jgi:hypothetical protein